MTLAYCSGPTITLQNRALMNTRLRVLYTDENSVPFLAESGLLWVGQTKSVTLPIGAKNIKIIVQKDLFAENWRVAYSGTLDGVSKCIRITGVTLHSTIKPCKWTTRPNNTNGYSTLSRLNRTFVSLIMPLLTQWCEINLARIYAGDVVFEFHRPKSKKDLLVRRSIITYHHGIYSCFSSSSLSDNKWVWLLHTGT